MEFAIVRPACAAFATSRTESKATTYLCMMAGMDKEDGGEISMVGEPLSVVPGTIDSTPSNHVDYPYSYFSWH